MNGQFKSGFCIKLGRLNDGCVHAPLKLGSGGNSNMNYHVSTRAAVLSFTGLLLVAVFFFVGSRPAASQNEARCFGCSADGKATPMMAGHPDLSGVWGPYAAPAAAAAAAGGQGGGQ